MNRDEKLKAIGVVRHLVEHSWCQDALGYDAEGQKISPDGVTAAELEERAQSVCLEGAIQIAFGDAYQLEANLELRRLLGPLPRSLHRWNDAYDRTVDDVLALIDRWKASVV